MSDSRFVERFGTLLVGTLLLGIIVTANTFQVWLALPLDGLGSPSDILESLFELSLALCGAFAASLAARNLAQWRILNGLSLLFLMLAVGDILLDSELLDRLELWLSIAWLVPGFVLVLPPMAYGMD